jgi:hypothetical protein
MCAVCIPLYFSGKFCGVPAPLFRVVCVPMFYIGMAGSAWLEHTAYETISDIFIDLKSFGAP